MGAVTDWNQPQIGGAPLWMQVDVVLTDRRQHWCTEQIRDGARFEVATGYGA